MSHVRRDHPHFTAPPSFALVVSALTWLCILSFIEIHSEGLEPQRVENDSSALVWLLAHTTA